MAVAAIRGRATEAASAWRSDVITGLLALWMTLGSYVDAWAHTHLASTQESFLTPWHGVLYSGWLGAGAWIFLHRDRPGYRVGLYGAIAFGVGGVFDMVWHALFGIESNAEALISPAHLFLLAAHLLIISTPLRATWSSETRRRASWREFTPVALALVAGIAGMCFIVMYGSPFNDFLPSTEFAQGTFGRETRFRLAQKAGLLTFYVTTLLLVAPLLTVLKRWKPPFGAATLALGLPAIGIMVIDPLLLGAPMLALSGVTAGFLADILIHEMDPGPHRTRAFVLFGALVPIPLVVLSLVTIASEWGLGWGINLVTGSVFLSSMIGAGLALALSAPARDEVHA